MEKDTRVLPGVVGGESVSCGGQGQVGRPGRQRATPTSGVSTAWGPSSCCNRTTHGLPGLSGEGAGHGRWPCPAAARDLGASDWEGSPPDHSSGDLGLVGTTEILQSQTSDLRLGCACGGLWFPTQYWDFCWLLWSRRRLRLLCVSTIIAAQGFGVVGRDPSGRASVYCRGCRTPKSC